jgi:soluble lytic murein transglycosylase-like protein
MLMGVFTNFDNPGQEALARSLTTLGTNIGEGIRGYRQQKTLEDLGALAQKGDYNALAAKAIEGGDTNLGLKALAQGRDQAIRAAADEAAGRFFGGGAQGAIAQSAPSRAPAALVGSVPAELLPVYKQAEAETGIPAGVLIAQHRQESNFDPNAVSKTGALGIGQVLPSTARDPGYGVAPISEADLRDPAKNILFSARYLAARGKALGQNDFSTPGAAAAALRAYNGNDDPNYVQKISANFSGAQSAPANQVASNGASFLPRETGGAGQPSGLPTPSNGATYSNADIQALMRDENYRPLVLDYLKQRQKAQEPATPVSVGAGASLVDPRTGRVIVTAPARPERAEAPRYGVIGQDEFGQPQYGYPPTREEFAARGAAPTATISRGKIARDNAQREAEAERLGLQGEDRVQYITSGRIPSGGEKQTGEQANAATFATRMNEAEKIISDPTNYSAALGAGGIARDLASGIPIIGNVLTGAAPGGVQYQKFDQARRDFVNAVLRKESGAAITPEEFENAEKQYFPIPGNPPEVIAQKEANRATAIDTIAAGGTASFRKGFAEARAKSKKPKDTPSGKDSGVAIVESPEAARSLPKGTRFRAPDGREFVR